MSRAFVLIEACIACMILSFALTAVMPLYILSTRADIAAQRAAAALQLSNELMDEVLLRKWDQNTPRPPAHAAPSAVLGPEAPPKDPRDKRTFDDVDDFSGWSENPPLDPVMRTEAGFAGYAREVSVVYVDAALRASAGPTDYKKVTVCTRWPAMVPVCVSTVVTNR